MDVPQIINYHKKGAKDMRNTVKLSWEEIKSMYPNDYVGLTNIERDNQNNIISAVVVCSTKDTSYTKMLDMAFDGKFYLIYPNSDNVEFGGGI